MIAYISIGNSDDKLTQQEWADFYATVDELVVGHSSPRGTKIRIHGRWASAPTDPFQNACWCIEIDDPNGLREELRRLTPRFQQDSIAWAWRAGDRGHGAGRLAHETTGLSQEPGG